MWNVHVKLFHQCLEILKMKYVLINMHELAFAYEHIEVPLLCLFNLIILMYLKKSRIG